MRFGWIVAVLCLTQIGFSQQDHVEFETWVNGRNHFLFDVNDVLVSRSNLTYFSAMPKAGRDKVVYQHNGHSIGNFRSVKWPGFISTNISNPGTKERVGSNIVDLGQRGAWFIHIYIGGEPNTGDLVRDERETLPNGKVVWKSRLDADNVENAYISQYLFRSFEFKADENTKTSDKSVNVDIPHDDIFAPTLPIVGNRIVNLTWNTSIQKKIELSPKQRKALPKEIKKWIIEKGFEQAGRIPYVSEKEKNKILMVMSAEQFAIANRILIKSQLDELIKHVNQEYVLAATLIDRKSHWACLDEIKSLLGYSDNQTVAIEKETLALENFIKKATSEHQQKKALLVKRTEKRLHSVLENDQAEKFNDLIGDEIESDEWGTLQTIANNASRAVHSLRKVAGNQAMIRFRNTTETPGILKHLRTPKVSLAPLTLYQLIRDEGLSAELELSKSQRSNMNRILKENRRLSEEFSEIAKSKKLTDAQKSSEQRRIRKKMNENIQEATETIILPQKERIEQVLRQIHFMATTDSPVLFHSYWRTALSLSSSQTTKIKSIELEFESSRMEIDSKLHEKVFQAEKKTSSNVVKLLNSKQNKKLARFFGEISEQRIHFPE